MSSAPRGPIDWTGVRLRMEVAAMEMEDALNPPKDRARKIMEARAKALARPPAASGRIDGLDVVCFSLSREHYAIESRFMCEVVAVTDLTPLPGVPAHVMGVVNLRGNVLAVMDLRRFFGLTDQGVTDLARLIVLGGGRAEFGIVADATEGQILLPRASIKPATDIAGMRSGFITGVAGDGRMIIDGARLLADDRFTINHQTTRTA